VLPVLKTAITKSKVKQQWAPIPIQQYRGCADDVPVEAGSNWSFFFLFEVCKMKKE